MDIVVVIIFWLAFSAAVGMFASGRGHSGAGWFALSLVISPLLGFIFAAVSKSPNEQERRDKAVRLEKRNKEAKALEIKNAAAREKKEKANSKVCPDCAETVKAAAKICRFCRYEFGVEDEVPESGEEPEGNTPVQRDADGRCIVCQDDGAFVVQNADGTLVEGLKTYPSRVHAQIALAFYKSHGEKLEDNVPADSNAYKGLLIVCRDDGKFVVQNADGTRIENLKPYSSRSDAEVAVDFFKFKSAD